MLSTLVALGLFAAPPPPPPSDEKVWELIFELETDKGPGATEQLKPIAVRALPILLKAARAGGMLPLITQVNGFCGAPVELLFGMRGLQNAGMRAGGLLITFARTDAALVQALGAHPDPLARMIALIGVDRESPAFLPLVEAANRETSPDVARLAIKSLACASRNRPANQDLTAMLEAHLKKLEPLSSCEDATQAAPFVDAFAAGLTVNGWGTSGEAAWVSAGRTKLSWRCALAVYEGLAGRERFDPGLLLPLMARGVTAEARKPAGELLQRDQLKYPEKRRDEVVSKLVLAGLGSANAKITVPDNPGFAESDTLAAAALLKSPGAREAIEKRFVCRGFRLEDTVGLLGFVPSRGNADAAVRIAELCKDGKVEAVGALIRMKDRRAIPLFASVVDDPWVSKLGPVLRENWSKHWEKALRAQSKSPNFAQLADAVGHPELKAQ